MNRKFWLLALIVAVSVFSFVACSNNSGNPKEPSGNSNNLLDKHPATPLPGDASSNTGTTDQTLRIGLMSDVGAIPFMYASEQGFFKDAGLNVEMTVFKSAMDRDTALQTGNLDGVMADTLTIIFYNNAGFDAKMTSNTYGKYDMITRSQLTLEEALQLSKLKVGISSNTVIDFVTDQIVTDLSIKNKTEKIAIPQMPVRLEMLKNGELDAATMPDPLASAAVLDGGVMISGTEEMNLYPGVFIFATKSINDKQAEIAKFYQVYNETMEKLNGIPVDTYYDMLQDKLGFPPILKGNFTVPKFQPAKAADEHTYDQVLEWMQVKKLTDSDFTYAEMTDNRFVK